LHIVDKFAKELNIKVKINSKIGVGTEVILDFSKIDGNAK
jgi:F0F1-type ATP synthase delta subunit